jgi:hypothetical protein
MTPREAVTTADWTTLSEAREAADIRRTITGSHYVVLSCTQGFFTATLQIHRKLYRDRSPLYRTVTL